MAYSTAKAQVPIRRFYRLMQAFEYGGVGTVREALTCLVRRTLH
jgi:hypothetical protein